MKTIDPQYHAGGSGCDPAKLKALSTTNAEHDRCQEAAEQHRLQSNDLIQQTRAADAAAGAYAIGYNQTLIALAGTLVGFFTLIAAVLAALYAKKAAEAAERGIGHSLDTAHAELRAYIVSDQENLTLPTGTGKKFSMMVRLRNGGSTPAANVAIEVRSEFRYKNGGLCTYERGGYGQSDTLSPGAFSDINFAITLADDEMRALKADKGALCSLIRVSFTDNFGQAWYYGQTVMVTKESLTSGTLFTSECNNTKVETVPNDPPKRKTEKGTTLRLTRMN